jgi:hypothetical protein
MTRAPSRILVLVFVLAIAIAAPASAAPDYTATLSAAATTFAWDGGPGNGFNKTEALAVTPCGSPNHDCEDLLAKVDTTGSVLAQIVDPDEATDNDTANTRDLDLVIFQSDASGAEGKQLKSTEGLGSSEKVTFSVPNPGYYLVRVDFYRGANVTYKGTLTLSPDTAVPETPPTATAPGTPGTAAANQAPTARIGKLARSVKAARLKGFSGTAADDGGVARVEVGLVQVKGKRCSQLTVKGTFSPLARCGSPRVFLAAKGGKAWSFKLRKALKRGSYVLYARATDAQGVVEGGFGAANRRAFKVA